MIDAPKEIQACAERIRQYGMMLEQETLGEEERVFILAMILKNETQIAEVARMVFVHNAKAQGTTGTASGSTESPSTSVCDAKGKV